MAENQRGEPESEPTTYNILFVCTGNTCRSPMAQAIAARAVAQRGWNHVAVASAGLAAGPGAPAAESARRVVAEDGLDLEEHRSRPLTPDLVEWADLVLAMTPSHAHGVAEIGGEDKVALITDFLDAEDAGRPVSDPFGGDDALYRTTYRELARAIDGVLGQLEPILAP